MAIDWWSFLDLADKLHTDASSSKEARKDALLRSAISRAYYATLMSIGDMLATHHNFTLPEASSHQAIKNELATHFKTHPEYRAVLMGLQGLQTTRTIADYRRPLPADFDIESRTSAAIEDAKQLRKTLNAILTK